MNTRNPQNNLRGPISKLGKRRQVVIPRDICNRLCLREGDFVEVKLRGSSVLIQPKKIVDADDVLTLKDAAIVSKGERQLNQGKGVLWDQAKQRIGL